MDEALAEMANAKRARAKTFMFQLASKIFTREDLEVKLLFDDRLPGFKQCLGAAAFAALLVNFIKKRYWNCIKIIITKVPVLDIRN